MWGHGVTSFESDSVGRLVHANPCWSGQGCSLAGFGLLPGPTPGGYLQLQNDFPTLLSGLHALLSGLLTLLSELPTLLSVRVKGHAVLLPDHVAKAHQQGYMQLPSGLRVLLSGLHGLPSGLPTLLS